MQDSPGRALVPHLFFAGNWAGLSYSRCRYFFKINAKVSFIRSARNKMLNKLKSKYCIAQDFKLNKAKMNLRFGFHCMECVPFIFHSAVCFPCTVNALLIHKVRAVTAEWLKTCADQPEGHQLGSLRPENWTTE